MTDVMCLKGLFPPSRVFPQGSHLFTLLTTGNTWAGPLPGITPVVSRTRTVTILLIPLIISPFELEILVQGSVIQILLLLRLPSFRGFKMEGKSRKSSSSFVGGDAAKVPKWAQKTVTLPSFKRGCHLVTPTILKDVEPDLAHFQCGLAHFFLQHTSASLTINENYDSDVLDDVETWLNGTVPEGRKAPWKHTIEGPDDMPAHIKSSMFGCTLTIPITDGRLNLGTWQGIWLCEHRDHASARKVVITMTGV